MNAKSAITVNKVGFLLKYAAASCQERTTPTRQTATAMACMVMAAPPTGSASHPTTSLRKERVVRHGKFAGLLSASGHDRQNSSRAKGVGLPAVSRHNSGRPLISPSGHLLTFERTSFFVALGHEAKNSESGRSPGRRAALGVEASIGRRLTSALPFRRCHPPHEIVGKARERTFKRLAAFASGFAFGR
jgi:hypothetical protein